ncbi:MFS/sugar transport protein [Lachnospiraceae bacterium C7]|nr:MFS/sugar transport protein [Lachnospiraceae bacterium C7]
MNSKKKLSVREKLSFSSGEMGTNLLFAAMSAYLMVYYTNYAKVNPAMVGSIMLVSKFLDAFSDVVMGYIEERFAKPGAKAKLDNSNIGICDYSIYSLQHMLS